VGEVVRVIAINRKTGYIGSTKIRLASLYSELENTTANDMVLRPHNLKVIATRDFKVEAGLEKGEKRIQLIGSEGAGLTSDNYVKIQTVWLDEDGSVLPEDLPDYTGRLAISTGNATEDFSGNFEIKPSFENDGAGPGKLQTRPAKYVPIKVPVFNELDTLDAQNALRDARQQGIENLPDKAAAVYHWVYRPEMQFNVFDWKVQQILRTTDEGNATNIINLDKPVIGSGDVIDIFFTLMEQAEPELARFSGARELILEIGGQEIQILQQMIKLHL